MGVPQTIFPKTAKGPACSSRDASSSLQMLRSGQRQQALKSMVLWRPACSTFSSLPAAEGAAGARPPLAGAAQLCSAVQVSQLGSCTGSSGPQVRIFGPQLGSQQVIFKAILQIPHGILQKSNEEKGIIWSIFQMGKQGL